VQLRHVKHPFGAVIDKDCKILILGSVPSVKSVEGNFYYMHPQNRFWKMLSRLLGEDLVCLDTRSRAEILLRNNIALYDSVEECDILGSSDSKIANVIPADVPRLIEGTSITRIFCNGAASYDNLIKFHPSLLHMAVKLPSTSPANASFSLERLTDAWSVIMQ